MKKLNFRYYVPGVLVTVIFLVTTLLVIVKTWMIDHWGVYFAVPSLILAMIYLIDQKLWSRAPFKFIMWAPDLRGQYSGAIEYENVEGEPGSLRCQLIVRQTGSDIWVESSFHDSDGKLSSPSESMTANIIKKDNNTHELIFTYLNEGADHLSAHRGTNELQFRIDENNVKTLTGRYYTSRRTKGTLTATTNTNT